MSKKIQLSVPKPCHENWEIMTPVEKGKFCGSCQKQVVDFSTMSDRQVAEFFKKPSTGSVCGRFMTDQLDREISIPKKRVPFIKYFFQILIPALFVAKASAQKMVKPVATPIVTKDTTPIDRRPTMGIIARPIEPERKKDTTNPLVVGKVSYNPENLRTITGFVTDDTGNHIPFASVMIKGSNKGTATDEKGKYQVKAKNGDVLVFSSVGYVKAELRIGAGNYFTTRMEPLTIKGEIVSVIAGTVVCTKPEKKPVQQVIPVIKENGSKNFKIFPNPLRAGEQLTVDYKRLSQGTYQLQWLDQSGQLIHEQPINVESKSGNYRTAVPVIIAGSYFLVLTEKRTGKKYTEKVIIQ